MGATQQLSTEIVQIPQILPALKLLLTRIGSRLSTRTLLQLQGIVNYLQIGRWMRDHGYDVSERAQDRRGVWDVIVNRLRHRQVLYLEFGVESGHSMIYWSRELKHPGAILHGFDSFEGLHEEYGQRGLREFGQCAKW